MEKPEKITTEQLLAEVNHAIRVVLAGGQQVTIGNRSVTRPTLSRLVELKNELEAELNEADSDGFLPNTFVAFFDRR